MSARLAPTARRFGIAEVFAAKVGVSYATYRQNNTNTKLGRASNLWVGPLRTAMPDYCRVQASKLKHVCFVYLACVLVCIECFNLHEKLFKQGSTATVDSYLKPSAIQPCQLRSAGRRTLPISRESATAIEYLNLNFLPCLTDLDLTRLDVRNRRCSRRSCSNWLRPLCWALHRDPARKFIPLGWSRTCVLAARAAAVAVLGSRTTTSPWFWRA